jgi:peptidylprolyl isomerase
VIHLTKTTKPALFPAALLLLTALVIAAPGCGDKSSPAASSSDSSAPSTAPTDAPPQMAPQPIGSSATAVVPTTTLINGKSVKLKSTPSGLKYYDLKVGTGPNPKIGQTVSVQYTGTLLDGTKFDSSYDHGGAPIDFPIGVGQVIKGWDEGVPTMKVGGKRRLVIPASLAYGDNPPTPQIPPGATLIFDIELVGIK